VISINITKPLIERFGDDIPIDPRRKSAANAICHYFENENDPDLLHDYYRAVKYLLSQESSQRILYYLPFEELTGAPESVRNEYIATWCKLLTRQDVRENFHKGDIFEPDARPNGEFEWIVKGAHLTPWLIRAQYLDGSDVIEIVESMKWHNLTLKSFRDTWGYINDHKLLSRNDMEKLRKLTEVIGTAGYNHQPLYESKKRAEWLNEISKPPAKLSTPNALLQGPFSPNLEAIHDRIEKIKSSIGPNDIILLGGSQLKGYGTVDSDLDIWDFYDIAYNDEFRLGSPDGVHIYFNSIWITGKNILRDIPAPAQPQAGRVADALPVD